MSIENIGPKIREFRKKRKLSQSELAKSLGYSGKSVISHIESGDRDMTYEKMLLLLRTYMLDANELFEVEHIDNLIKDYQNMPKHEKVVIYIHGLGGSSKEAEEYSYLSDYDVKGLDYKDGNPWDLKSIIQSKFKDLIDGYKEVIVLANSIGAFYVYEYLSEFNITKAFFISPIASMSQIIMNLMMENKISLDELKEEKLMKLDNGQTLSYEFYEYINNHKDNWNVPTEIIYGEKDELVYLENVADFLASHPNSKLTILKGAHHYLHTKKEKEFIKNWILKSLNK